MTTQLVYLTTSEVADRARVKASTVRRWIERGVLKPAIVTPGGQYRFAPEQVDALLTPKSSPLSAPTSGDAA